MRILMPILVMLATVQAHAETKSPLIDAHIHYSHDAWDMLPPEKAVEVLREAGLRKAFVSSSSDDGTQMLFQEAPDLIVPVLRPYRRRGELSTWYRDETIIALLEERLAKYTYAGIGEFHVYGGNVELPVVRRVIELAREKGIFLHAHSDAEAVRGIFEQDPDARVLWAHAGFADPAEVRSMLGQFGNLSCDLAIRSEQAQDGKVDPEWRKLFLDFPDRFMIGTDTYTPERWYYVITHADWSRQWLADLPADVGEKIAWKNAAALADWALARKR